MFPLLAAYDGYGGWVAMMVKCRCWLAGCAGWLAAFASCLCWLVGYAGWLAMLDVWLS